MQHMEQMTMMTMEYDHDVQHPRKPSSVALAPHRETGYEIPSHSAFPVYCPPECQLRQTVHV
eukprot:3874383-Pyramimonas_sp.AAC.1